MRKVILPEQTYFITTNTYNRRRIFWHKSGKMFLPSRKECDFLIKNLVWYRSKFNFHLHGYVIMPDHLHMVLTVGIHGNISDILRDVKHRVATEINELTRRHGIVWQSDFYEHGIRNELDFEEKLRYIHYNPVRAGLVLKPEDAYYSSYRSWTFGDKEPLALDYLALSSG